MLKSHSNVISEIRRVLQRLKDVCKMQFIEVTGLVLSLLSTLCHSYDHINKKDYKVVLTNGYEDGTVGVIM